MCTAGVKQGRAFMTFTFVSGRHYRSSNLYDCKVDVLHFCFALVEFVVHDTTFHFFDRLILWNPVLEFLFQPVNHVKSFQ